MDKMKGEKEYSLMGARIKERRKELGLTQTELGKYIGVQSAAIAKYEKGRVSNIKRDNIAILAKVLKCDPVWLMGYDDPMERLCGEEEFKDNLKKALDKWKDIEVEFTEADIQSIVEFIKFKAVEK